VVYPAFQDAVGVIELYSVPIAGGRVVKLNGALGAGGIVFPEFRISPDSSRVVYQANQNTLSKFELFGVPIAGGSVVKLNGELVTGGNVQRVQLSPDGNRAVYLADQDTDGVSELYMTYLSFKSITSYLGRSATGRRDSDVFRFRGQRGEQVTIRIEKYRRGSGRRVAATLTGRHLTIEDAGRLPMELSVRLPSTGRYELNLNNLMRKRRYVGNYCLTLESSQRAWKTLRRTASVE
jgi:hypothetical protein